jgi:hypothetical protein
MCHELAMVIESSLQLVLGPRSRTWVFFCLFEREQDLGWMQWDGGRRRVWEGKEAEMCQQQSGALVRSWTADIGTTA